MKIGAEIGDVCPQGKNGLELLEAVRSKEGFSPRAFGVRVAL